MSQQIIVRNPRRRNRPRRGRRLQVVQLPNPARRRSRRSRNRRRRRQGSNNPLSGRRSSSEYLRSLLEPERWTARIPDACGWNTVTFQSVQDFTLTTGTDGSSALAVYPTPVNPTGANQFANVQGVGTQIGVNGVWTGPLTTSSPPQSASVQSVFSMFRPVSGVLLVEFIGSTGTDQGQILACPLFRGEQGFKTFASQVQSQYSVAGPLRNGLRFLWKPMDELDFQFVDTETPSDLPGLAVLSGLAVGSVPFNSVNVVVGQVGGLVTQPSTAILVHIAGAVASATVARARWIVNYEAVPDFDTLGLFEVTPHESNPGALAQAMNVISSVPWGDVWQGVAGIGGAILEQAAGTQLPNYLGSMMAGGATALLRGQLGRRGRIMPRGMDLSID